MVHIKHILCPVDFSEFSRHAFDRAVAVARSYGADSRCCTCYRCQVPCRHCPTDLRPWSLRVRSRRPRSRARGAAAVSRRRAVDWCSASLRDRRIVIRPEKSPGADIKARADLIVMGTHGRSGFDRFFLGSVAEKTLRTSRVPVLVVPPSLPDVVPAGRDPFRSILCAVDFSQDSARALGYASSLAQHAAAGSPWCTRWSPCRWGTTRWWA